MSDGTPLGALLIDEGLLTEAQLDAALAEQARSGKPLGRLLIEQGTISEAELVRTLARQVGLEFVDLNDRTIDGSVAALVTESLARRYQAIPIGWEDGRLVVAMADPSNVFAVDDIRASPAPRCAPSSRPPSQIIETIERFFRVDGEVDDGRAGRDRRGRRGDRPRELSARSSRTRRSSSSSTCSSPRRWSDRASDIHVEPTENDLRIRFRIDGVLHEVMRSPRSIQAGVISRLKVMADINIAERRVPQDGRITHEGRRPQHRPARRDPADRVRREGRHANPRQEPGGAAARGSRASCPRRDARFEASYRKPYGTILVTGPTGSGKSTTLYATLNQLNTPDRNIITVEDPVEYRLPGHQPGADQPEGRAHLRRRRCGRSCVPTPTSSSSVRSATRRPRSSRIEAALTGHLVLSTLHTNDAASTPMRLVEMGVEPFLVTSALDCVVAQRLARRLCDKCKEPYQPTEAELVEAGWPTEELDAGEWPTLHRAVGCGVVRAHRLPGPVRHPRGDAHVGGDRAAHHRAPLDRRPPEGRRDAGDDRRCATTACARSAWAMTSLEEIFRVVA